MEDRFIRDVVKLQENIGLSGITDGEYRRTLWHADFLRRIGVVVKQGILPQSGRDFQGGDDVQRSSTRFETTGKLRRLVVWKATASNLGNRSSARRQSSRFPRLTAALSRQARCRGPRGLSI